MQDGCRILGNGKSGKMAKKYQHHKFPSCLGYPKHEGKDEENLTHFFRYYRFFWGFANFWASVDGEKVWIFRKKEEVLIFPDGTQQQDSVKF